MKFSVNHLNRFLVCSIFVLSLIVFPEHLRGQSATPNECLNKIDNPPSPPTPIPPEYPPDKYPPDDDDEDDEEPDDCPKEGAESPGSRIFNGNLDYLHAVFDYRTLVAASSCGPCTDGSSALPTRPGATRFRSLSVKRLHRSTWLGGVKPSFAHKVYWDGVDKQLHIPASLNSAGKSTIQYIDAGYNDHRMKATYSTGQQRWVNWGEFRFAGIYLTDATGTDVADDLSLAKFATLLHHNGRTEHFELFEEENGDRWGRLIADMDRNGNALEVFYSDAIPSGGSGPSTGTVPSGDVPLYFRQNKVSDAYGHEAIVTYGDFNGQPVITKIDLPTQESIEYTKHGWIPGFGGKTLREVTHPDGTKSTFSGQKLASQGLGKVSIFDAAAAPTKRRKDVYFSLGTGPDENGVMVQQPSSRVRKVINSEGELIYANHRDASQPERYYVYEGGNKVRVMDFGPDGGIASMMHSTEIRDWTNDFYSIDLSTIELETRYTQIVDKRAYPSSTTDSFGRSGSITRDARAPSVLGQTFADGSSSSFTRNPFQQPTSYVDRLGRSTVLSYDAKGNVLSLTSAPLTGDESTHSSVYNAQGLLTESRDPLYDPQFPELHSTKYNYDQNHYLISIELSAHEPGGTRGIIQLTHDTAGRLTSWTDPVGRNTSYTYDSRNRIIEITYNDTSTEAFTYGTGDDANLIIEKTDRNGIVTKYTYDLVGRTIETRTAFGLPEEIVEICTYLEGTNQKLTCRKRGELTEYGYDHFNRRISTTRHVDANTSLTETTEYDNLNRVRSRSDEYGRRTFYLYDVNDRIVRTVREMVPNGLGAVPNFLDDSTHTAQPGTVGGGGFGPGTHTNSWNDPRDVFLRDLTRPAGVNPAYTIMETENDAEGQLLLAVNEREREDVFEYDELGRQIVRVIAEAQPKEQRTEIDFDAAGNRIEMRHPRHFTENIAAIETWTYTGRNDVATHTVAKGDPNLEATESWKYVADGRVDVHTDFRNHDTRSLWHACCGRLQATVERDGASTFLYNTDFLGQATHTVVVSADPTAGGTVVPDWHDGDDAATESEITRRFDGLGRVVATTQWLQPLGNVDDDARSNLGTGDIPIATDNTVGLTTTRVYDEDLTDGVGLDATFAAQMAVLNFGPDADGYAVASTNAEGETTATVQDGIGRTVMFIDAEGNASQIKYDDLAIPANAPAAVPIPGDLVVTETIDPLGNQQKSYTNADGQTIAMTDSVGASQFIGRDSAGNETVIRDPNGLGENCTYDLLDRKLTCADLQEQTEGTQRSYTWNAHNQLLSTTNAEGHATQRSYDVRDRLINETDANSLLTQYGYDANNNRVSLTDPRGNTRTWTYDPRNVVIQKTYPDGASDRLLYENDAHGRVVKTIRQDNTEVRTQYDLAGRITQRTYHQSDGALESTDTFAYDGASRLTATEKGRYQIQTAHTYAADGQPITESFTIEGRTYQLARGYDAANRVSTQTFADGKVMTWTYNARNLVTHAHYEGDLVLAQSHDAAYRLTSQTFGNNLTRSITYGRNDNLRTRDEVGGVAELKFDYTYAADKNVASETTTGGLLDELGFTVTHDPGNRVSSWNRTGAHNGNSLSTQSWTYDGAGNWNATTKDSVTEARAHNSGDETTSVGGSNLTYDPRGNLLEAATGDDYLRDLDNRIQEIDAAGVPLIEYQYDAFGRRVFRRQGTSREVLLWWGMEEQSEHKDIASQETIQNDLLANPNGGALNTVFGRAIEGDKNEIQYFHKNYLDHVYAVSDDGGNLLEHYRYSAFGEVEVYSPLGTKVAASMIDNDMLWNVKRYDFGTGMYMYAFRNYLPSSGRWAGRDPIEEEGGVNSYRFVANAAINWIDIFGLAPGDKWYGYNNKNFQRWYHRHWKCPGDPDATEEEIADAHEEWESQGRPSPEGSRTEPRNEEPESSYEEPEPSPDSPEIPDPKTPKTEKKESPKEYPPFMPPVSGGGKSPFRFSPGGLGAPIKPSIPGVPGGGMGGGHRPFKPALR